MPVLGGAQKGRGRPSKKRTQKQVGIRQGRRYSRRGQFGKGATSLGNLLLGKVRTKTEIEKKSRGPKEKKPKKTTKLGRK